MNQNIHISDILMIYLKYSQIYHLKKTTFLTTMNAFLANETTL